MAYKQTQNENVFIANGKKIATFLGYYDQSTGRIRYEIRAGLKGTGRLLAKENCLWGCASQEAATRKIAKKVGGIEWEDAENYPKFHAAQHRVHRTRLSPCQSEGRGTTRRAGNA